MEKNPTRRELLQLAQNGTLVTAGLGISSILGVALGQPVPEEMEVLADGSISITQEMSNKLKALGIKNNGYGMIIFKFNDIIISSSHAIPLDGDIAAAKRDNSAKIALKISDKQGKPIAQTSGKLGNFEIQM